MKNLKHIFIALAFGSTISLTSCSDFKDITTTDQYSEDMVFSDPALTQAFVNNLYLYVRHGALEHTLDGLTDDAYFTHNYGQKPVNEATVSESDLQWFNNWNNPFRWVVRYMGIRYCNFRSAEHTS